MRWLLPLLLLGCAAKKEPSLVLQERVADEAGPAGERTCPMDAISAVRMEKDTLWLNDRPWTVHDAVAVDGLAEILALCGQADAIGPLRAWRKAELAAEEARKEDATRSSAEQVGASLLAGAVNAAASAAGVAADPDGTQLSHAMRDQNLRPASAPATHPPDSALAAARQTLRDALLDPPTD